MPSKKSKPSTKRPSLWKVAPACSEAELTKIAAALARDLGPGDRVFLEGPMGAGKTTFARALLIGLGVHQPPEGSPSFALAHEYDSPRGRVIHMDFYRLRSEMEIEEAGIASDFWERPALVVTEWISNWPEFRERVLSTGRCWQVSLDFAGKDDQQNQESRTYDEARSLTVECLNPT